MANKVKTSKIFKRRWRGFTEKEVSERMAMIGVKRFKTMEEKKAHARMLVDARGSWQLVDGKRIYVKRKRG